MIKNKINRLKKLFFSKTAKNIYWAFVGNGFYTFFTFIFIVLIAARNLGPEDFGRFSALFAFSQLFAEFSDIGIGPSLSRFIPSLLRENKKRKVQSIIRAAFQMEMLVAALLTLFVFIIAPFLSIHLFDGTDKILIRLSSLGILGIVLFLFVYFTLSAHERFRAVAALSIIVSTSRVLLAFVFVMWQQFNLFTALVAVFLPTFVTWIVSMILLSPTYLSLTYEKGVIKNILSFSKFIAINKVFTSITSRIDILMLIALVGAFESGIYSAAIRITQVYPIMAGSLLAVLAPRFSVYHTLKQARDFTIKAIGITVLLLGSIGVFFIISRPFILLVFGDRYAPSIPVFQTLLIPMAFFVAQLPLTGLIVYTLKKPHIFALSAFIQLSFVVIGNIIFIPQFGVFGPVFGLSFGYLGAFLTLLCGVWYFRNEQKNL